MAHSATTRCCPICGEVMDRVLATAEAEVWLCRRRDCRYWDTTGGR